MQVNIIYSAEEFNRTKTGRTNLFSGVELGHVFCSQTLTLLLLRPWDLDGGLYCWLPWLLGLQFELELHEISWASIVCRRQIVGFFWPPKKIYST